MGSGKRENRCFYLSEYCATVSLAELASANIVGYTTKTAEQGKFIMYGSGFSNVSGSYKINELVSGAIPVDIDWDTTDWQNLAVQIQSYDEYGSLIQYFYVSNAWLDDGTEEGQYVEGWCDADGILITEVELTPGFGFWVKSPTADSNIVVSGAVPEEDVTDVKCLQGFSIRSYPYPMDLSINSDKLSSADIVPTEIDWDSTAWQNLATQIQAYDENGSLIQYFYVSNAWLDDGTEEGQYVEGWCDADGIYADVVVKNMTGFWIKGTTGEVTLTFKK